MKPAKKLTGSVYQTSAGGWRAQLVIGTDGRGQPVRRTRRANSRTAAQAALRDLKREAAEATAEARTVAAWAATYLERIAKPRLNPRTFADHRGKVENYITPTLGRYMLTDIGPEEVRELHDAVRAAGVTDRTLQITHSVLSTMMAAAVREGLLDSNPVDRVDRPRATSRPREALTIMQARTLISSAYTAGDPLASLWAVAILTGARRGELLGLEWNRVDLTTGALDLSWQLQSIPWAHGAGCVGPHTPAKCPTRQLAAPPGFELRPCYLARAWTRPKTTSGRRVVPLPEPARVALEMHRECSADNPHGLVWATPDGRPLHDRATTKAWKAAAERAGVPPVDLHAARHTTATLLLEAGVSPEVIVQLLGHSSVLSTRTYIHVPRPMAAAAMQDLGALVAPDMGAIGPASPR